MNGPQSSHSLSRAFAAHRLAASSCALLACLCLLVAAPAALAAEETTPAKYIHEKKAEYEQQLGAGEITSATFNRRARSVHLTLKNGQKALIKYNKGEEPNYAAQLAAHHVTVTVLKPSVANAEFKKEPHPVHHKIRYIVGGVVIAVIVVVGGVLLFNRRRRLAAE
jgi:hypothetical protein